MLLKAQTHWYLARGHFIKTAACNFQHWSDMFVIPRLSRKTYILTDHDARDIDLIENNGNRWRRLLRAERLIWSLWCLFIVHFFRQISKIFIPKCILADSEQMTFLCPIFFDKNKTNLDISKFICLSLYPLICTYLASYQACHVASYLRYLSLSLAC